MATRPPPPGLVHHSDRGVQYASADYVKLLQEHDMIPSMSRPANPYDNASCESFLKTLKREEIYANDYRTLEHLAANIETFIDEYYNQCRLHSALGYRPPAQRTLSARLARSDVARGCRDVSAQPREEPSAGRRTLGICGAKPNGLVTRPSPSISS